MLSSCPPQEALESKSFRGSIQQDYIHYTNEGFGSLARNIIYPILHIAVSCVLQPHIFNFSYHHNSARPCYTTDLPSIADFLSIDLTTGTASKAISTPVVELEVNTWNDPQIGACYGDGRIIASQLNDYLNRLDSASGCWYAIRLVGAIRCMDPTPLVYNWLQNASNSWNKHLGHHLDHPTTNINNGVFCIAAHVRVPEAFTSSDWKEDNHIMKLCGALDVLFRNWNTARWTNSPNVLLEIYTEENFLIADEQMMLTRYSTNECTVRVFRGSTSTLLHDVQQMATADLFIPSSSHLSAFCGYLTHSIILISDPSRWEYFSPHRQLGCTLLDVASEAPWSETFVWQEFFRRWNHGKK